MPDSIQDFEKAISELQARIEELKQLTRDEGEDRAVEIETLETRVRGLIERAYSQLSPWDKTQVARNPLRPYTLNYIQLMTEEFIELHGDRHFGDDPAMVGGLARLDGQWVVILGHQKGRDLAERRRRNFGSARPEGYRKAMRLMRLAEKFGHPVICLVDTPAADCSVGAEERGISAAIAQNMHDMFQLSVPVIVVVIGEGGSGGAIGIGVGDRVLMLEHAVYSVIPPEGCAAIIWRDAKLATSAAAALRLTAEDAWGFGVVDEIIPEPLGGAHRDYDASARAVKAALLRHLAEVQALSEAERMEARYQHFRRIGEFAEPARGDAPPSNGAGQAARPKRVSDAG